MVAMSDTAAQPLETSTPFSVNNQESKSTDSPASLVSSDYEKCREQRIKENRERMQKLGIYDLSLKLKSTKPNGYRKNNKPFSPNLNKTPNRCISTPLPSSAPSRRSSRLQSTPAICYTEVVESKKGNNRKDISLIEKSRPEVYTDEHEKLLGQSKMEWTLFVDGYGKDGKRIYDQVRGKTCHQCRQKTLGYRTHCIECNMVQGQFCGDCLYMRYGENVLEAMHNPDWICPVCRGICNCSLCRQAKGWAPTGALYRKISNLGYKSVAHYLIQTRRSDPNSEKNEKTEIPGSAKRSLSFSNEDGLSTNVAMIEEKPLQFQSSDEHLLNDAKLESDEVVKGDDGTKNKVNSESEEGNKVEDSVMTPETGMVSGKKRLAVLEAVSENSIAGRLRSRRK